MIDQLKQELDEINAGEGDWELFRQHQREYTQQLLETAIARSNGVRVVDLEPEQLKVLYRKDFPAMTMIRVRNHRIEIGMFGGEIDVWNRKTMTPTTYSRWPWYIREFVR